MIGIIREIVARINKSLELRKYSPSTIAEYLRKQGAQIGESCFIVPRSIGTEPYLILIKISNHVAISQGDELLVIDDGSTDNTTEVLRPFYDQIQYIRGENCEDSTARDLRVHIQN